MKRNVSLNEISDGRLYQANDMVKADCGDCKNCFACCQGMGDSIKLDPLDIFYLTTNLNCSFETLLQSDVELNVVDGIILPNLKMKKDGDCCGFLNEQGRCQIHAFRPSICRLFPLGRYYEEDGSFRYFLQVHECKHENRSKVKVKKWIDTPNLKQNEQFIKEWHALLTELQEVIANTQDDGLPKRISMLLLQTFYLRPYQAEVDFYEQFNQRLCQVREYLIAPMPI